MEFNKEEVVNYLESLTEVESDDGCEVSQVKVFKYKIWKKE